jgi:hypothetical protein
LGFVRPRQRILFAGIPFDQEIDVFLLAQKVPILTGIVSAVQTH